MTEANIHELIEQTEENQKLTAEELGVAHKLEDDPDGEAAKKSFFTGAVKPAEKSDNERAAAALERIAVNSVVIAEAAGVSEYKVNGEATSAAEKNAGFFDPR
jgi:hypothetical protein